MEFGEIPVYAMITKTKLPLDVATLKPLLTLKPATLPPSTPIPSPLVTPVLPGPGDDSNSLNDDRNAGNAVQGKGKVVARRQSVNAAVDALSEQPARTASSAARVAVAHGSAESYGEDMYDDTMAGVTLVARGPVKLRSGSGAYAKTYRGTIEATLFWTNGLITLPGFISDALAVTNGGSTNSLFSTTVTQMLQSTIINGYADAKFQPLVGNSASSTAVNDGSTSSAQGGTVNVTQEHNTPNATVDNATLTQGNTNSDNTLSVINDMAGALEMYIKLLKTMCKQHKDIPIARPANLRLDVSPHHSDGGYEDSDAGLDSGASGATASISKKKSSSLSDKL